MAILIITVIALGLLFLAVSHVRKDKAKGNWVDFYAKGREAGFSFKEIEMLRRLAAQCNLETPGSLFWSQSQLDKCIHSLVRAIKMSGGNEDMGTQDFLSKLYNYRKKIEMDKVHLKNSITASRQIDDGQTLRVLVPGLGVFKSQVVKNTNQYITISRPVGKKNSSTMPWTGTKISVYFWREDDAGYVFDSEVLDEVFSVGIPSLKISTSDTLFRTQKRKSVRMKMHKAAFLYLVPSSEPSHKIEIEPGLKCFLENLSDTGYAVTVGGRADAGVRVKVQFALDNAAVCMTGTVRSVDFTEVNNRSIMHIEAETLPLETRNLILGEMFGMLPEEDEDELPFRVMDGETEGVNTETGLASGETLTEALTDSNGPVAASVTVDIAGQEGMALETSAG